MPASQSVDYSPDLSPIEMAIAKVKAGLRRKGACDEQALESAIMETLPTVSAVAQLKGMGARFRNEIVTGSGGLQILIEDPPGTPIELFQPVR